MTCCIRRVRACMRLLRAALCAPRHTQQHIVETHKTSGASRWTLPHLHAAVLQKVHVHAVQALQLRVLLRQEALPIQGGLPRQLPPAGQESRSGSGGRFGSGQGRGDCNIVYRMQPGCGEVVCLSSSGCPLTLKVLMTQ